MQAKCSNNMHDILIGKLSTVLHFLLNEEEHNGVGEGENHTCEHKGKETH